MLSTVAPEAHLFPSIFKIPQGHEVNLFHSLPFAVNTGWAEVVINTAPLLKCWMNKERRFRTTGKVSNTNISQRKDCFNRQLVTLALMRNEGTVCCLWRRNTVPLCRAWEVKRSEIDGNNEGFKKSGRNLPVPGCRYRSSGGLSSPWG